MTNMLSDEFFDVLGVFNYSNGVIPERTLIRGFTNKLPCLQDINICFLNKEKST